MDNSKQSKQPAPASETTVALSVEMKLSVDAVRHTLVLLKHLCGSSANFDSVFSKHCSDLFSKKQISYYVEPKPLPYLNDLVNEFTQKMKERDGFQFENHKDPNSISGQVLIWTPAHICREMSPEHLVAGIAGFFPKFPRVGNSTFVVVTVVLKASFDEFTALFDQLEFGHRKHILVCKDNLQESLTKLFTLLV